MAGSTSFSFRGQTGGLGSDFPYAQFGFAQERVAPASVGRDLPFEFAETGEAGRVEGPAGQGRDDGTAGFDLVVAVAEPASSRELLDVGKGLVDVDPTAQRKAAQTWGVDEDTATGNGEQLARRRGVPAPPVAASHRPPWLERRSRGGR